MTLSNRTVAILLLVVPAYGCQKERIVIDSQIEVKLSGQIVCPRNCPTAVLVSLDIAFGPSDVKPKEVTIDPAAGQFSLTYKKVVGYVKGETAESDQRVFVTARASGCSPYMRNFPLSALPLNETGQVAVDLNNIVLECGK